MAVVVGVIGLIVYGSVALIMGHDGLLSNTIVGAVSTILGGFIGFSIGKKK